MITARIAFVAEGISIDSETQALSAYSIMEGIAAEGFPVFISRISFFALFERDPAVDPNEYQAAFTVSLGEQQILTQPIEVNFRTGAKARVVIRMQGFVVPNIGRLNFEIRLGEQNIAEYSLPVTQRPQPAQAAAPAAPG